MSTYFQKFASFTGQIIQYGCILHCTVNYLGELVMCQGPSMEPTLFSDDVIFTEHITPTINKVSRGDIVIAKCPSNPQQNICKRVVALQGDKIRTGFTSHIVPIGHVWLEGDNSTNSCDSRNYGPVPLGLIKSRAVLKIWPFKNMMFLTD
ncbi:unnamed protein product [Brassicogethes aeneus]|uniref:Mitochondrial inner membrane protease subunit n=1 Tax=Brassicogethes aeneus TaxID=1431903 RepID=A0A9P0BCL4_BRAAE|nr:unnamed protein product [Brassicogethes aeneus]